MRKINVIGRSFKVVDTGATCWTKTRGHQNFWDVFEANEYEPATVKRMQKLLKPGDLFVDVGAWIGGFTLLAEAMGCRVIAIEPDRIAHAILTTNIDASLASVQTINAALVPDTTIDWGLSLEPSDGSGLSHLTKDGDGVEVYTVQRYEAFPVVPAFVKIDIEGYETELMPTLGPWLAARRAPVQVSLHGQMLDRRCFFGYDTLIWPESPYGDIFALPFVAMKAGDWQ